MSNVRIIALKTRFEEFIESIIEDGTWEFDGGEFDGENMTEAAKLFLHDYKELTYRMESLEK